MKILFVVTELGEGGAENALGHVASGLFRLGHGIHVVCLFNGDGAVAERLRSADIDVDCIDVDGATKLPAGVTRLRKIIQAFAPDVIHSWLFHANLLSRLVIPKGIPLVASLRVVEPRKSHVWLDSLTRSRVSHCICVSDAVRNFATEQIGIEAAHCTTIENGVDFDAFESARQASRLSDQIRGLCVARFTHQKGHDILIEALAQLPPGLLWHWTFVGAEPEPDFAKEVRQRAVELGIASRIDWRGPLTRDEVVDCYAAANLIALPSRWEGQANVVLEALAAGVPVIASDTDGVADLIARAPNALTVVAENAAVPWSKGIEGLWRDHDRRCAQIEYGLTLVRDRTWQRVTEQHLEVYKRLY
jgi:glycosyltransferase involved in cell wall biosynthesis